MIIIIKTISVRTMVLMELPMQAVLTMVKCRVLKRLGFDLG